MGLWVRAGSWSAQQLTDGFIPTGIVLALGGSEEDAETLVKARLWTVEPGGWRFHEWNADGRQPTRDAVEERRSKTAERVARWREEKRRRTEAESGQTPPGNAVTTSI